MAFEPGTILGGKFRVERLIGEGGMGAVYEVEHELTKHRRALKTLHGEYASSARIVKRFLNEASAAGRIGNPHIVETFDAGHLDDGDPYIVMELLDGISLEKRLQQKPRLDLEEALEIATQAGEGVQAAHAAGIVHRDLKPENLFLVAGERTFVKILDFGISKFDPEMTGSNSLTQEGSALGTPFYMPPEQVRGETDIDHRADIYALGVVLYECLAGSKPFYAETLPHLSVLIHEGKYPPLAQRRPDLPKEVSNVIARALAVDRADRHGSVEELVAALRAAQVGATAAPAGTLVIEPDAPSSGSRTSAHGTPEVVVDRSSGQRTSAAGTPPQVQSEPTVETEAPTAAPSKSSMPLLVGAALLLGAAALAVAVLRGGDTNAERRGEPAAAPTSASKPVATTGGPEVSPALGAPPAEKVEAQPDAAAASSAAKKPVVPRTPVRAPPASTTGKTRAEKHGLTDNPYE